jgi:hypothetical protein
MAAGRFVLKALPGYAIFRPAVQAADNNLLGTHDHISFDSPRAGFFKDGNPDTKYFFVSIKV